LRINNLVKENIWDPPLNQSTLCGFVLTSCFNRLHDIPNKSYTFKETLSEYEIFKGIPSNINPSDSFIKYELATTLFSDFAEKQRLIYVPTGYPAIKNDNLLPDFPDVTHDKTQNMNFV
jgi:hypothetical protein